MPPGTNKKFRIAIAAIALVVCIVGVWIALPSNQYVRMALMHLSPTIDQHAIFANRIVKANDPRPWKLSEYYNKMSIPDKYLPDFQRYGTVAYVIIKNGELMFEQYWDDYSLQSLSNSFSMAKSIVSLAIGCAIDDGFIRDVDQSVSDFFPLFTGYGGKTLTIRNLLTMSAGMDFKEEYSSLFSPTTKLYYGNDLSKVTFVMKEIAEPGRDFKYQSAVTQLLAYILEDAVGENISSYVSRKLWTPLQAEEDALWSLDRKDGMEKAFCCFNSNACDFARIGQLILNGGKWNGRQIVSEKYVTEAITPDASINDIELGKPNSQYGFQIWQLTKNGMKIPYLRGLLGQYVFAIPDKNAVVVRLGRERAETLAGEERYPADIDVWLDAALDILDSTPQKARLVFGGDLMQHSQQVKAARNSTNGGYDFNESLKYLKPIFSQADLSLVNLETTLSTSNNYSGYPLFRSPKEIAVALKNAGIDIALMANNHVFDGGSRGVQTTQSALNEAGILHTGVFTNSSDFIERHPLQLQVGGLNIALLNYTYGTNGLSTPNGLSINRIDSFKIAYDLSKIDRTTTNAIIVIFHWGYEYARIPNTEQKALAELCHRYGAEIVIGSHPHVIQPVEYKEDADGNIRKITAYSLGNLVSNQRDRYTNGGLVIILDIIKEKDKPVALKPLYVPVWVHLPEYNIIPPSVADTIQMPDSERKKYEQFYSDTYELLKDVIR
ncbi:MAG: CapA family protein [Tannerella sp.]|nr:CapA family protein [Tannerella sp.]